MIKAVFQVSPKLSVEVEGENQRELFEKLANFQEVFGEAKCCACTSTDVRFVVRENDGNKYYELHCQNSKCRAKLAFGCHKKNPTLFPKRKDDSGYLPNNGWVKWEGKKE